MLAAKSGSINSKLSTLMVEGELDSASCPWPFTLHTWAQECKSASVYALTHTPLPYANKSGRQGIYENAKSRHIYKDRQLSHREKI